MHLFEKECGYFHWTLDHDSGASGTIGSTKQIPTKLRFLSWSCGSVLPSRTRLVLQGSDFELELRKRTSRAALVHSFQSKSNKLPLFQSTYLGERLLLATAGGQLQFSAEAFPSKLDVTPTQTPKLGESDHLGYLLAVACLELGVTGIA